MNSLIFFLDVEDINILQNGRHQLGPHRGSEYSPLQFATKKILSSIIELKMKQKVTLETKIRLSQNVPRKTIDLEN